MRRTLRSGGRAAAAAAAVTALIVTAGLAVAGCGAASPGARAQSTGSPGAGAQSTASPGVRAQSTGSPGARVGADHADPGAIDATYLLQVQAKVLVDGAGDSLYMVVPDARRAVTCVATCAEVWPPAFVTSGATVRVGPGVNPALVSTTLDPAGGRVATYDRWPLYTYVGDVQPGIAAGQGLDDSGGYWYLVRPDGIPLMP